MGKLQISNELKGTEVIRLCFKFLRREHKAKITKLVTSNNTITLYNVEGEGIPIGYFSLIVDEIVPNVLAITIE